MKSSVKAPDARKTAFRFLLILLYAALLAASGYSVTKGAGILRTLPLVLLLPAAATFFYPKKTLAACAVFAVTLLFAVVESDDIPGALGLSAAALLFAAVGILIKRFFVTAAVSREKRNACAVCGGGLLLLGIVGYAVLFGNPVSALSARHADLSYLEATYGTEAPQAKKTWYDAAERRYFTDVSFRDESPMEAEISSKAPIIDGYANYYEYRMLSARREEMVRLFAEAFPKKGAPAVRVNPRETEIAASPKSEPAAFYDRMVFDIAFYDQITEADAFAKQCAQYAAALDDAGFVYGTLHFYGGFADAFAFTLTAFPGETLTQALVQPFAEADFDRYDDGTDDADHWRRGV